VPAFVVRSAFSRIPLYHIHIHTYVYGLGSEARILAQTCLLRGAFSLSNVCACLCVPAVATTPTTPIPHELDKSVRL
jgi:hypothetical protein